jgi:hypothetical protein
MATAKGLFIYVTPASMEREPSGERRFARLKASRYKAFRRFARLKASRYRAFRRFARLKASGYRAFRRFARLKASRYGAFPLRIIRARLPCAAAGHGS